MVLSKRQKIATQLGMVRSRTGEQFVALSNRQKIVAGIKAMAQPAATVTTITWMSTDIFDEDTALLDAAANAGGGLVYAGAFLGLNGATGYARQFVSADTFIGIALRGGDNSGNGSPLGFAGGNYGNGTAGNVKVPFADQGYFAWRGTITGLTGVIGDANTKVYCSDGGTLTTASGGGNAQVGVVKRYDADNLCWIIKLVGGIERNG